MKMVMTLRDFTSCLGPMLKRFNGLDATEGVRADVEGRIKRELIKHCIRDDACYRITDVAVSIETVGDDCRLAVEWI